MSILNPQASIGIGLATAALVWGIYQTHLPNTSNVKGSNPNAAVASMRKVATWEAAGIVAGISLIAKDPTIFIIGGSMVAILDFTNRTAHWTDPNTNQISKPSASYSG